MPELKCKMCKKGKFYKEGWFCKKCYEKYPCDICKTSGTRLKYHNSAVTINKKFCSRQCFGKYKRGRARVYEYDFLNCQKCDRMFYGMTLMRYCKECEFLNFLDCAYCGVSFTTISGSKYCSTECCHKGIKKAYLSCSCNLAICSNNIELFLL